MREWIIHHDVWGVALLMFLQNIFPVIPSEIIMPLAGFLASVGILKMKGVVLAGLVSAGAGWKVGAWAVLVSAAPLVGLFHAARHLLRRKDAAGEIG